jgi:hypothetical protein
LAALRGAFIGLLGLVLTGITFGSAWGDPVSFETARVVAEQKLRHHLGIYGSWNGHDAPTIADGRPVQLTGRVVGYNFSINPSGHILIAVDDEFSPILLYSDRSHLDLNRIYDGTSIEAWIFPEIEKNLKIAETIRATAPQSGRVAVSVQNEVQEQVAKAWSLYKDRQGERSASLSPTDGQGMRSVTVGPLLTTTWGQSSPYNLGTPNDSCAGGHTLTGCVATAWAQLLRYWRWPLHGTGSKTYTWSSTTGGNQVLTVDFSAATYDWANMPNVLTGGSSQAEKDAVSLLMYHMGVSAAMDFGCSTSGSGAYANDVLDTYFSYKAMNIHTRSGLSASQWFSIFKGEFDADPRRPAILSIWSSAGGHEVVVDGYQNDHTNLVHINYGWNGSYNGYYNITSNFQAGGYTWEANSQVAVVGIEPDNQGPIVNAGLDQTVEERTSCELTGSASDPEGHLINGYRWSQVSGPSVSLANASSAAASFTTPTVHITTQLVFRLRADDEFRAVGTDTVTITVNNTDNSTPPPPPPSSGGGGGSSGGGCFISSLN